MKKYRCLSYNYSGFQNGEVYSENIINRYSEQPVSFYVTHCPNDWKLVEDEFVLSKNWHIIVTEENQEIVNKWWKIDKPLNVRVNNLYGMCTQSNGIATKEFNPKYEVLDLKNDWSFGTELTTEQFAQYILKEKIEKVCIGYKCVKDCKHFTIGKVYKLNGELTNFGAFIDDFGVENGMFPCNKKYFEPVYKYKFKEMRNQEIVGYKLKEDCRQFIPALEKISSCYTGNNFPINSTYYNHYKNAGILDLWFEPIYKTKVEFPEIYEYKASITLGKTIKYGCFEIEPKVLDEILSNYRITKVIIDNKYHVTRETMLEVQEAYRNLSEKNII